MLKKHVVKLSKLSIGNQLKYEEYVDSIPAVSNESSDDVMNLTNSLFKEARDSVPENVLDRTHRIGSIYTVRVSNKKCKSIIVRFTTFRRRTLFYRARKISKA